MKCNNIITRKHGVAHRHQHHTQKKLTNIICNAFYQEYISVTIAFFCFALCIPFPFRKTQGDGFLY